MLDERLTYLSPRKLRQIEWALAELDGVPGCLIETGVALGGSAVVLAARADRAFHGYDVFGMIPPPRPNDPPEVHQRYATIADGASQGINGDDYYGYRHDLYEHVASTLARYSTPVSDGVHLHKGLFEDTLHPDGPVALAHIDCDWYDPVRLSLERIEPFLSPGGFLVGDDYYAYDGARRAFDEFMGAHPAFEAVVRREHLIIRKAA